MAKTTAAKSTAPAKRATRATRAKDAAPAASVAALNQARQVVTSDGLTNLISGMGGPLGTKRGNDTYTFDPKTADVLSNMYRSDWLSRKVVDIVADDMTVQWRNWQASPAQIEKIETAEKALNLRHWVNTALKMARIFGGAALVCSEPDGDSELPLIAETVKKDGLRYIFAVPRQHIDHDGELDWAPDSDHFGQPEFYRLNLPGAPHVRIHWSRVHRFIPAPYPDPMMEGDCWGDSTLDVLADAIRDAGIATNAGAALIDDLKTDIVQMENLESHLASNDSNDKLIQRMMLLKLGKSVHRILLMGGKEKYQSKQANLANLDKALSFFMQVVSGACDIPATRFLSQSPGGQNATGESDMRNYAQTIKARQERELGFSLARLDEMLIRHALGNRPKKIWYIWQSIYQQTPKEVAETNKVAAEADNLYAMSGLVPAPALEVAVQNRMIESGMYPGLEEELRKLTEAQKAQKYPEPAPLPEGLGPDPDAGDDPDDVDDVGAE